MSFAVLGWVEYNTRQDRRSSWEAVLSLDPFDLLGDDISNFLFGLAKHMNRDALFFARGVPSDASDVVRAAVKENKRLIRKHGEGEFGHTYALWGDIQLALASSDAPRLDPEDDDLGWTGVVDAVRALGLRLPGCREPATQLRLIVWAWW